jgi:CRISPR-associated protein Csx16
MTSYFVSGHQGALDWAKFKGIDAVPVTHLDPAVVQAGDIVIGTLPVHRAAEICARGAHYLHLVLNLSEKDRHRELTAADMEALRASIEEYEVRGPLNGRKES